MKVKAIFLGVCLAAASLALAQQQGTAKNNEDIKQYAKEKLCDLRSEELKKCQETAQQLKDEIDDDRSPLTFTQLFGYGLGLALV